MNVLKQIMLIDDDEVYNFICSETIKKILNIKDIITYTSSQNGLNFLAKSIADKAQLPDLIFIDINMPILDGWSFIEEYQKMSSDIAQKVLIYIQSSSVYDEDIEKSKTYAVIDGFITKPLSLAQLMEIKEKFSNEL